MRAEEQANGRQRSKHKAQGSQTPGRLQEAFGAQQGQDTQSGMDWAEVDSRHIAWVVVNASAIGGAVTFGKSRDGGALMVTLLLDGDRKTWWISPRDDAVETLTFIAEVLAALA